MLWKSKRVCNYATSHASVQHSSNPSIKLKLRTRKSGFRLKKWKSRWDKLSGLCCGTVFCYQWWELFSLQQPFSLMHTGVGPSLLHSCQRLMNFHQGAWIWCTSNPTNKVLSTVKEPYSVKHKSKSDLNFFGVILWYNIGRVTMAKQTGSNFTSKYIVQTPEHWDKPSVPTQLAPLSVWDMQRTITILIA